MNPAIAVTTVNRNGLNSLWGMQPCFPGFPDGSVSKESACSAGDLGSIPGLRRLPGRGHDNPLQYSCLENTYGQRSLVGCGPWGHNEPDTTEWLSTAQHSGSYGERSTLLSERESLTQVEKRLPWTFRGRETDAEIWTISRKTWFSKK